MEVLIVDDHPFIHEMLGAVVKGAIADAVVHAETDVGSALKRARGLDRLELVLLDLGLPGCAGIEALQKMRAGLPGIRIVVVSGVEDPPVVQAALAAGAAGYIPKTTPPAVMVAALRLIADGGTYIPSQAMAMAPEGAPSIELTGRQTQVLQLLIKGLGNQQIAKQLDISENTVKQHAHALYGAPRHQARLAYRSVSRRGTTLNPVVPQFE